MNKTSQAGLNLTQEKPESYLPWTGRTGRGFLSATMSHFLLMPGKTRRGWGRHLPESLVVYIRLYNFLKSTSRTKFRYQHTKKNPHMAGILIRLAANTGNLSRPFCSG